MELTERDWSFVVGMSSIHFVQHVFRILPPVLPLLAVEFPYPLWKLGALVSVYFLGSGVGQTPLGVLADRYDRRFILPPGIGLMGGGYLVFAVAPRLLDAGGAVISVLGASFTHQFLLMGLGAFVAGLGASAIHPVGYPLVATNVSAESTGSGYGVWGSAAKFGDAAAPAAIAILIPVVQWDGIFFLFGIVGIAYAVGLFYAMSQSWVESRPADQRAGDAAGTEPEATTESPTEDWRTDPRHYAYPMVALFAFFVARAFSEKGLKTFLPTFLVGVYGYSFTFGNIYVPPESVANVYFMAVFLVAAVVELLTGFLVDRHDSRTVLIAFFVGAPVALLALATGTLSPAVLLAVLVLLGVTNWGWIPARDTIVNDVAPPVREGRTFGYLHTVSHLVSAVAPVAIGYMAERSSLDQSFVVLAMVMVVAILAIGSLYSRRVYRPINHDQSPTKADD
jgi:MFS family permease